MLVTGLTIALIFVLTACAIFALTRAAPKEWGVRKGHAAQQMGVAKMGMLLSLLLAMTYHLIELTRRVSSEFSPNPVFV